jgi:hypothetical protein
MPRRAQSSGACAPRAVTHCDGRRSAVLLAALAVCVGWTGHAPAEEGSSTITRVEEDWRIVVDQPDLETTSPQITVVCSPDGDLVGPYAVFELNYQNLPEFAAGGLQLQSWVNDQSVRVVPHERVNSLATPGEELTFTMSLATVDGDLVMSVTNGQSTTWGAFGQGNSLSLRDSFGVSDLNAYTSAASLKYSKPGFGGNRVRELTLVEVRYYSGEQLVRTDDTPRPAEALSGN